jgi:hypothetical protein
MICRLIQWSVSHKNIASWTSWFENHERSWVHVKGLQFCLWTMKYSIASTSDSDVHVNLIELRKHWFMLFSWKSLLGSRMFDKFQVILTGYRELAKGVTRKAFECIIFRNLAICKTCRADNTEIYRRNSVLQSVGSNGSELKFSKPNQKYRNRWCR